MKNKYAQLFLPMTLLLMGCATMANAETPTPTTETIIVESETQDSTNVSNKASSMEEDKQETVIAKAKADGSIYETSVEVSLKHTGEDPIQDMSNLTNIKNTSGNEEFTQDGMTLVWDNQGEDIQYKGDSSKSLPVQLLATYRLDGKDINYSDLENVTGKVEIKYSFTNNEKEEETYTPFITFSLFMLDEESCSNIQIDNGKILHQENTLIAVGYTTPSLNDHFHLNEDFVEEIKFPNSFTLSFDATNYTLDSTSTIITNGLFEDINDSDIQDLIDLESDLDDFSNAGDQLSDGIGQYNQSMTEFEGYSSQMLDGIGSLTDGTSQLDEGLQQVHDNMSSLTDGASSLYDGLMQMQSLLESSSDGLSIISTNVATTLQQLNLIVEQINAKVIEVNTQIETLNNASKNLEELKLEIQNNASLTEEEKISMLAKIPTSLTTIDPLPTDDLTSLQTSVTTLVQSLSGLSQLSDISDGMKGLTTGASGLKEGTSSLATVIAQLAQGSSQLKDGANTLKDSYSQMHTGVTSLSKASSSILDGFNTYKEEGVEELINTMRNLSTLGSDLKNLKKADTSYTSFTGVQESKTCSTIFLLETDSLSD